MSSSVLQMNLTQRVNMNLAMSQVLEPRKENLVKVSNINAIVFARKVVQPPSTSLINHVQIQKKTIHTYKSKESLTSQANWSAR